VKTLIAAKVVRMMAESKSLLAARDVTNAKIYFSVIIVLKRFVNTNVTKRCAMGARVVKKSILVNCLGGYFTVRNAI
jgi:hypothetical protein